MSRATTGAGPTSCAPVVADPTLPRAAARRRALVAGQDAGALHGVGAGRRAALALPLRPRLDDGRVLAAPRLDG